MWPVKFRKSKILKSLFFLTETDKKLDTENFRMIVQMVWKIYMYKKDVGGRAFCPLSALIGLKVLLQTIKKQT